jgi:long-subunit fatty acid transport protein
MGSTMRTAQQLALVVVACVVATTPALAQVADEVNAGIQFNFTPPGARSLAMGGAFVGLADDATAAYTNPAGLTTLAASEIGLEVRYTRFASLFTEGGHNAGPATGIGIDTVDGIVFGETTSNVFSPSFLSYVFAGEGWSFSLYRHQVVDYETDFQTQGAFFGDLDAGTLARLFPVKASYDLEIANYGFSVAFNVVDSFSIGLGASYYDFSLEGSTSRYYVQPDGLNAGEFFGPPWFAADNLYNQQLQTGSDRSLAFNVGLLWRASEVFWVGAVYRDGPSFSFTYAGVCGPAEPQFCSGGYGGADTFSTSGEYNLPTTYGLGVAIKPTDAMTITLDWDRIEYSALTQNMSGLPGLASQLGNFRVDDGDEFHLGFEYILIAMDNPVALRAGTWLDPAHQIGYTGEWLSLQTMWAPATQADDEWHFSAGLGVSFAGKFQLDFAFDFSENVDTLSLSGVYRF